MQAGLDGHHCHTQGLKSDAAEAVTAGTGLGRGRALLGPGGAQSLPPCDEASGGCAALHPSGPPAEPLGPRASPVGTGWGRGPASSSTFHILFHLARQGPKNKQTKENAAVSFLAVRLAYTSLESKVWLKRPSLE